MHFIIILEKLKGIVVSRQLYNVFDFFFKNGGMNELNLNNFIWEN